MILKMKSLKVLQIVLLICLVFSIEGQETETNSRNRSLVANRNQRNSFQDAHNRGAYSAVASGSGSHFLSNCDTKELIKNLNDRVSLLVTLDENDRKSLETILKRLQELDENNEGRLQSLSAQQMDFLKRLDSLEHIQRVSKHTLDELKDLNINRITRQAEDQTPVVQSDTINLNAKLDSLATFLTSTRQGIQQLQTEVAKLVQTNTNLQKRLGSILRRKQNRQPYLAGPQPNYLSNYAPDAPLITSCSQDAPKAGGILKVQMTHQSEPFYVLCEADQSGGDDWTVVLKRFNGVVNFRRGWDEYKSGFGNLAGEFFIGLEKLHALTNSAVNELLIILEDFDGVTRYAKYSHFAIAGESDLYAMNLLGAYVGDAGDSLIYHSGSKFSTFDRDNDGCLECNCAQSRGGGWWYNWCATSNLMGQYYKMGNYSVGSESPNGVFWNYFHPSDISLKKVKMLIRPIDEIQSTR